MKLCIPVQENNGLQSEISRHFGSAPQFLIVDTESGNCRSLPPQSQHHEHGECRPVQSLSGETVDGVVVGGIGKGALHKLQAAGIQVFISEHRTVGEVVTGYKSNSLQAATMAECCGGHGAGQDYSSSQCSKH